MTLAVLGHDFRYETENVIRIFFPLEKINVVSELPEVTDDCVITYLKDGIIGCEINIFCGNGKREVSVENKDEKEQELILARLLYDIFTSLTGIVPSWGVLTGVRPSKLMRTLISENGEEYATDYFRNELLVSDKKTALALSVAKAEDRIIALSGEKSYSLYVSIPFCPTRCSYCSFVSHSIAQAKKLVPDYVRLLCDELREISVIADKIGLKLETIYFGGGTPTSLDEQSLRAVTDAVSKYFDVKNVREYTIEAGRPDTLNKEKLEIMKNAGVTRISINPQTFNADVLENIGRKHSPEMTVEAFRMAREAGFDNINMDFIAGLPGDTYDSFRNSIDTAVSLSPENITIHTLALKRAANIVTKGQTDSVYRETAKMLDYADSALHSEDYFPYYMYRQSKTVGNNENVGWSKKDRECLYNIYMMEEIHTVLAAGGGAVTKLKSQEDGRIERIFNFKYPYEYISRFDELLERKKYIYEFYGMTENEH
ncbi:MAG: coproporphyrinogen dehydrogenase HemZ [Clostridia bacterium]|nr:coproporphyrinogen dehydrogenase HemZ [Clostridia bacterium]